MELELQYKIKNTKNYYNYLKENSYYIKRLNRSSKEFSNFDNFVKDRYGLRVSDKISKTIDNIDLINTLLKAIKQMISFNDNVLIIIKMEFMEESNEYLDRKIIWKSD